MTPKLHFEIVAGIIRLLPTGSYGEEYDWFTYAQIDDGVMTIKGATSLPKSFSIDAFRDLCIQLNIDKVRWIRYKDGDKKEIIFKVKKA